MDKSTNKNNNMNITSFKTIRFADHNSKVKHSIETNGASCLVYGSIGQHKNGSCRVKMRKVIGTNSEVSNLRGRLITVHMNKTHIAYTIQVVRPTGIEGMVRVFNAQTGLRDLIKGSEKVILDIQFAHIADNVLLAMIEETSLSVYKIEDMPLLNKLSSTLILKIVDPIARYKPKYDLISWCPYMRETEIESDEYAARQLVWVRGGLYQCVSVLSVIETFGTGTYSMDKIKDSTIVHRESSFITCATFSPDGTTLGISSTDGNIRFYQTYFPANDRMPRCLHEWAPHNGKPITNFFFLDDLTQQLTSSENSLWKHVVTTADHNAELKIWCCATWTCLQTISFQSNSPNMSLFFRIGIDRTSSYIVLSDIKNRGLYVLQIIVDNDKEGLQRFLASNKNISCKKALKSSSDFSNDDDVNGDDDDDDNNENDENVNNKNSGTSGDGDDSDNKNSDSGTSASGSEFSDFKSIAYVKSIAEFPMTLPMMGLAINGAAVRKYKCSNDAYFLNEMDDYDEVNQLLYCVVVDMFSVIPNSVEEISLLYQPSLSQTAELASSVSDDSAKAFLNNLTDMVPQQISIQNNPVKNLPPKKSIVNTLKDANLLKVTPIKNADNLMPSSILLPQPAPPLSIRPPSMSIPVPPPPPPALPVPPPPPPALPSCQNVALLKNIKMNNLASAALPSTTTTPTTTPTTTTTTTTSTKTETENATNETGLKLTATKLSPENNGVSKEVYETLFLLAQNQKQISIPSTTGSSNTLITTTVNSVITNPAIITATTTAKIETVAVTAAAATAAVPTTSTTIVTNKNSSDSLNGSSDVKGQNLLNFVNKKQQSVNSSINNITTGVSGSGIGFIGKITIANDLHKSPLTGAITTITTTSASTMATATTTTTTTATTTTTTIMNRQNKKSKKSDTDLDVQQNTAETSGGSSPSREVQKILSSKDELNDFNFDDESIDTKLNNFESTLSMYDTDTGLPLENKYSNTYVNSKYFALEFQNKWDQTCSDAGNGEMMQKPIKAPKPDSDDGVIGYDPEMPMMGDNHQSNTHYPINKFDLINSKLNYLIESLQSQTDSVISLREDIRQVKQSRKNDLKELCKTIVKGIKTTDTKTNVVIENSLKQFQGELRQELNEMNEIRNEKDKEFYANIIRDITTIINNHAKGNNNTNTNNISSTIGKELKPIIVECVKDSVKDAMKNVSNEIASSCENQMKNKITTLCTSKDFIDKMSNSISATVSLKIEDAYKEIVRTKILPAYDQSTKQLFSQVNETFMKATGAYIQGFDRYLTQYKPLTEEINTKLTNIPAEIKTINETSMKLVGQKLTKDMVGDLKAIHTQMLKIIREHIKREINTCFITQTATIEGSVLSAVTKAQTPAPNLYDVQEQIKGALTEGNVNNAFHIALLANELNLVEYTLMKADYASVFNPCVLEQTVLLSLIQQISSDILLNHTDIKQKYLLDSLLNLDLKHPIMKDHLPDILKGLHTNCQQYLSSYKTNPLCSGIRMILIAVQGLGYQF